jgi:hypothetical protein
LNLRISWWIFNGKRIAIRIYEHMDKLDKVRAGLESGTPVRAMIKWIENGDQE